MKLLFLVFTSLGFLVTPASGGGWSCGHKLPGHCRLHSSSRERSTFLCDRNKQCCVEAHRATTRPQIQEALQNNYKKPNREATDGSGAVSHTTTISK